MSTTRMTAFVSGHVQGVGFRWWTRSRALELGLAGYAKNLQYGRVEVVAEGDQGDVDKLLALLEEQPSSADRPGEVRTVVAQYSEPKGASGFEER
ncbi:acylphosphatase [Corynebacterium urinipleomorphum]|uniref:acylphosphatase n=1 Tax=Corynebacterium urinipleomorphum TaxID=1852380 RepID=UPI000B34C00B|nr:acylphosphatase [Corynebacterium urinipleomorphum]